MAVQAAEEDEGPELAMEPEVAKKHVKKEKKTKCKVEWLGEPVKEGKKVFYTTVCVNGTEVHTYIHTHTHMHIILL
jgi:hypothetical protein